MNMIKSLVLKVEELWSKSFGLYLLSLVGIFVFGLLITTTIGFATNTLFASPITTQKVSLDMTETSLAIQMFDDVTEDLFQEKVDALSDEEISYLFRSEYTLYVIKNYDHLGSESAVQARENGESIFVEESNKTIWCYEKASQTELVNFIDSFIDTQRNQF